MHIALTVMLGLIATGAARIANAADHESTFAAYNHTAWTAKEGAPEDVWALAQSIDGWLWLGSPTGLHRFDGMQFERVALDGLDPARSKAISTLYALDSGELWIGYVYGGASVLRDGKFTHFFEPNGLGRGTVVAFTEDADGTMWAACADALRRFDGAQWESIGQNWNFPERYATALHSDREGILWVAGEHGVFFLDRGTQRFQETGLTFKDPAEFITSGDGRTWLADASTVRLLPRQTAGTANRSVNARTSAITLFDHADRLWWLGDSDVNVKVASTGSAAGIDRNSVDADTFGPGNGLTNPITKTILEDQEGNLWVSTGAGLDRFRKATVRALPSSVSELGDCALAAGEQGSVWIGSRQGNVSSPRDGLWRFDGALHRVAPHLLKQINAAALAPDQTLWVGGPNGIWKHEGGERFKRLPDLPEEARGQDVHALSVDSAGDVWASIVRSGLFRFHNGAWASNGGLPRLPDQRPQVHARDGDRMWFGYRDGTISIVEHDQVRTLDASSGLDLGAIFAIHVGAHTLVAGPNNVAVLNDQRFHTITAPANPGVLEGVTGILETAHGDIWINGSRGAVRIAVANLGQALHDRTYQVPFELFGTDEGYPGMAQRIRPIPSIIAGSDGRLWFAGTRGVAWIDPAQLVRNEIPPPLSIRALTAGGRVYDPRTPATLDARTRDLQFDYTALSLTRPEHVQFRYRLEGVDSEWVDAGTRRQAFYTNLDPGRYRFRVIAQNEHGIWNMTGASVDLSIAPAYYQTRTFVVLCALALLAIAWLAYKMRARQLTARERGRLEVRLKERERIARDLHDTLLQGVQGLILKFQVAAQQIPADAPARQMMESALDRADQLLSEGRDRVQGLRTPSHAPDDLVRAIDEAGADLARSSSVAFNVVLSGVPRPLHAIVREEVFRIACEAMANAFHHAEASQVEVEVIYERRSLRLRFRDNGRGIDSEILQSGGRSGHWGLAGMRERGERIRARLDIWTGKDAGTEIELRVPAAVAYARTPRAQRWWRLAWTRSGSPFGESRTP